jgi:hypothetical protein
LTPIHVACIDRTLGEARTTLKVEA